MLQITCLNENEFNAVMEIIDNFEILRTDYLRPTPFFIKINREEFTVEFLMTPSEFADCFNESAKLQHTEGLFKRVDYGANIDYLFLNFYPAFTGLMLGDLTNPTSLIDIIVSGEDQNKPDIRESLRFRETYKEGLEQEKNEKVSVTQEQNTFFSANSSESLSTVAPQDAVYVNKHREYSSSSNQTKWAVYAKNVIKEISKLIKTQEPIDIANFFKMVGDKRFEIAKKLKHQFNYKDWNPGYISDINLTHFFGALRGLDNTARDIHERIILNGSDSQHIPAHFLRSELIEKLETDFFKKDINNDYGKPLDQYEYTDNFLEGDDANFKIKVIATSDKTQCQVKILYPNLTDSKQLQNFFTKLTPYFDTVIHYKTPENPEEVQKFLEALGKLSYHCYRELPFRLGTSAIVEWIIRGIADAKNMTFGQLIPNISETMSDWKELPQDWKAFLTFSEQDYATWFVKHAFTEIKLGDKVIFNYLEDNPEANQNQKNMPQGQGL